MYVSALCRRDERANAGFWKAHAARAFNLVRVPEQLSRTQARTLTEYLVNSGQMEAVSANWPDMLLTVTGGRPGLVWRHILHSLDQHYTPPDWENAFAMGINSRVKELVTPFPSAFLYFLLPSSFFLPSSPLTCRLVLPMLRSR